MGMRFGTKIIKPIENVAKVLCFFSSKLNTKKSSDWLGTPARPGKGN